MNSNTNMKTIAEETGRAWADVCLDGDVGEPSQADAHDTMRDHSSLAGSKWNALPAHTKAELADACYWSALAEYRRLVIESMK
jgi:hypothetical protein